MGVKIETSRNLLGNRRRTGQVCPFSAKTVRCSPCLTVKVKSPSTVIPRSLVPDHTMQPHEFGESRPTIDCRPSIHGSVTGYRSATGIPIDVGGGLIFASDGGSLQRQLEAGGDLARRLGQAGGEKPAVGADQWYAQLGCCRGPARVVERQ